jgi:O-antigen ligase
LRPPFAKTLIALRAVPLALAAALGAYALVVTAGVFGALLLATIALFAAGLIAWARSADAAALDIMDRTATGALLLVPAVLVVYFSFDSGGFFPDSVALADIVVAALLVIRLGVAERALESFGRAALVPLAGVLGLAVWALLSQAWSHAPGRATIAFDRDLLYALTFALFATVGGTRARLAWAIRAVAFVMAAIAAVALLSRVAPDILGTTFDSTADGRLAYPLTYWNALGAFCAVAAVLCLHLAAADERRFVRVAGSAAMPVIGAALLSTYSRGGLAVAAVGLVAYVVLGRPRGVLSALIATAPATAIAMKVTYDSPLLSNGAPVTAPVVSQGHHLGLVVVGCVALAVVLRIALLALDKRFEGERSPIDRHYRELRIGAWVGMVAIVAAAVALGAPSAISNRWNQFVNQQYAPAPLTRDRLASAANGDRLALWNIETNALKLHELDGTGADTFEILYYEHRTTPYVVVNAHSLYVETLGDLGIVGLGLILLFVIGTLVGLAPARRGRDRALYASLFSAGLAWSLAAGVDWDWQMPAASLWFAALGGLALGRAGWIATSSPGWRSLRTFVLGAAVVAAGVLPALVLASQVRLNEATASYAAGNCARADRLARSSLKLLATRAPPWQILALCDANAHKYRASLAALRSGLAEDPNNWELQAALAATTAVLGGDARAQAASALLLNPVDAGVQALAHGLAHGPSAKARQAATAFLTQQTLIQSG